MKLWEAPRLGKGPEPKATISFLGMAWSAAFTVIDLVKKPFTHENGGEVQTPKADNETTAQSIRIDEFLGGLTILPVRNSRLVEIRYASTDPVLRPPPRNALAQTYIEQNMEFKFMRVQRRRRLVVAALTETEARG